LETLAQVISAAKNYKGLKRKLEIGEILQILGESDYDDAGVLELEGLKIVVSADGITEDLVKSDPWFAGYYSVLVNVNDVVVKGAKPMGYVDVLSGSPATRRKMAEGIKTGLEKYGLKLLKGHTHPDSSYEAIDAAVVGIAKKVAKGTDAKPGDKLIMAIDLAGAFGTKGWVKCFDSTLQRTKEDLQRMISTLVAAIDNGYITSSRDISAPGILGSLAMLCEASGVGAEVALEKIPKPPSISLSEWLVSYPAMGFIFASKDDAILDALRGAAFTAEVVGKFTASKKIKVSMGNEKGTFMDLARESVFGLR